MITKGSTPTSYGHAFTQTGINFIKVESIQKGLLLSKNVTSFISEETYNFLARSQLETGDILFSIAGSIGTCAVVTNDVLPANTNQALAIIRGTQLVYNPAFLLICIQSSVVHVILNKARGGAMNNVSLDDIQNFVTPLPPLAEQHRIVAKVDELMVLCDQLQAAQTEREQSRDRLVAASLHRIGNLTQSRHSGIACPGQGLPGDCWTNPPGADLHPPEGCRAGQPGINPEHKDVNLSNAPLLRFDSEHQSAEVMEAKPAYVPVDWIPAIPYILIPANKQARIPD